MLPTRQGSFRLFRFAGIDVFLHWSWIIFAIVEIEYRSKQYSTIAWNALEYLSLFLIVLMHEFGHALACRSVGGQANQIVLWPLGGVAYVSPPQRPGAMLWSIVAGPMVNVMLAPILTVLVLLNGGFDWADTIPVHVFMRAICAINFGLLIFNLLPVYPLDGGQILRSLLWFVFGRATSLMITSIVGFVGVAGLAASILLLHVLSGQRGWSGQEIWLGMILIFILLNCWRGLLEARALARIAKLPRHAVFACPECKMPPVMGNYWTCGKCLRRFDTFATRGICPHCGTQFPLTQCLDCGSSRPMNEWMAPPPFSPHS